MVENSTVAIVGAGPLGLELAIALKSMNIKYVQFDRGQVTQMVYQYPPHTPFFSSSERIGIAGIPIQTVGQHKCLREEYLAYIRSVVLTHHLVVNTFEEVIEITKNHVEDNFFINTCFAGTKRIYIVKYIIIATGGLSSPRLLKIPGESLSHVSCKMEDPHMYFQKKVVVVGGRNSAVESALRLSQAGAFVTMAVRNEQFAPQHVKYWLLPELLGRIARGEIGCFFNSELLEIVSGYVRIKCKNIEKEIEVPADFIVKGIGFIANMSLLENLGVKLSEIQNAPSYDEETMQTNIAGVFVLGTIVGGTQKKYRVFIENSHIHVDKIMRYLCYQLKIDDSGINKAWKITPSIPFKIPEE
jgi:thioredoxin reductase (NADPH)